MNGTKKKELELNEEQVNLIAAGAFVGFIQFWKNRELDFYKQLSKMRLK